MYEPLVAYYVFYSVKKSVFGPYVESLVGYWSTELLSKRLLSPLYSIHKAELQVLDNVTKYLVEN